MSEIKRYMPYHQRNMMLEHNKGRFVEHTAHLAALKQARIDAVREFGEWCKKGWVLDDVDAETAANIYIEQLKERGE